MTFDELANFVCGKVNQVDSTSTAICKTFINARYRMIYDTENWKDSIATLASAATIGEPLIDFPGTFLERLITIQVLPPNGVSTPFGKTLESVDRQFISESFPALDNPDTTLSQGEPKYYTEFFDQDDSTRKIRVYPTPDKGYIYHLHGKALFVPLSIGADTPILRNIDNCLIAFVQGDMLQRARQYGKAEALFTEAAAHLDLMRKVEKENSNLPRRSKNITVSGDSLAELVDAVCCRIGDYAAPTQIVVREFLRRKYQDLYDSNLWLESTVMARVDRDGSEVILPEYVDRIIAIRGNSSLSELVPTEASTYFGISPDVFEQSGSPVGFTILTPSAVATLPVGTEQMRFVSSDATDKSEVFIRGEAGGVEVSETVTLNGTADVFTYNVYDMPMTIAKQVTAGDVTVYGRISALTLVRILAAERERKHIRLWLQPFPDDTIDGTECLVLGKRRIHPFVRDEDTPLLRGIGNVLIAMATSAWFTKIGNDKGAAAASAEAKAAADVLIARETSQTAYQPRIIPFVETGFGYGGDSLCSKGYW